MTSKYYHWKKKQEKWINKNKLIQRKKSCWPRVRVTGNSDSKIIILN